MDMRYVKNIHLSRLPNDFSLYDCLYVYGGYGKKLYLVSKWLDSSFLGDVIDGCAFFDSFENAQSVLCDRDNWRLMEPYPVYLYSDGHVLPAFSDESYERDFNFSESALVSSEYLCSVSDKVVMDVIDSATCIDYAFAYLAGISCGIKITLADVVSRNLHRNLSGYDSMSSLATFCYIHGGSCFTRWLEDFDINFVKQCFGCGMTLMLPVESGVCLKVNGGLVLSEPHMLCATYVDGLGILVDDIMHRVIYSEEEFFKLFEGVSSINICGVLPYGI